MKLCLVRQSVECIFNIIYYAFYFAAFYFVENSAFGKLLKLLLKSDYVERNCVWLDKV